VRVELCAERQKQDRRGKWVWDDDNAAPNHYGDALKEAVLGLGYTTRNIAVADGSGGTSTAASGSQREEK
jgi:hypothetical protein